MDICGNSLENIDRVTQLSFSSKECRSCAKIRPFSTIDKLLTFQILRQMK